MAFKGTSENLIFFLRATRRPLFFKGCSRLKIIFGSVLNSSSLARCFLTAIFSFLLFGMAKAPPLIGGAAPLFELKSIEGQIIRLSDLKGKFIVLNFWATWCAPCVKEMPELQKAHQFLFEKGVNVLAINLGEKTSKVEKFIQEYRLSIPVLLDSYGNTSEKYRVIRLPVTYFITPDGILRDEIFGGGLTKEIIETKVKQLVGQTAGMRGPGIEGKKSAGPPAAWH